MMLRVIILAFLATGATANVLVPLASRGALDIEGQEEQDIQELEERGTPRLQCLTCEGTGQCVFRRLRCAKGELCIAFHDGQKFFYGCAAPMICEQMANVTPRYKCCNTDNCNWDL